MSKKLVLIDSDSLCYLGKNDDNISQIINKVDGKISAILKKTEADFFGVILSKGRYFRYPLSLDKATGIESYKNQRVYPKSYVKAVKEYLITKYDAIIWDGVEADDVIMYLSNQDLVVFNNKIVRADNLNVGDSCDELTVVISSIDKDILNSRVGVHLNYNKKDPIKKTWDLAWVNAEEKLVNEFVWMQMLMGDNSDGIVGIAGVGQIGAKKIIENSALSPMNAVFEYYIKIHGVNNGIFEFQKNYRLLHMLDTDEDFMREVGYIPTIPEFNTTTNSGNEEIVELPEF